MRKFPHFEQLELLPYLGKWFIFATLVAALAGTASAFFLLSLDLATAWREAHPWIIWLLPFAGMAVGLVYFLLGKRVDGGNNLLIEEIHDPKQVRSEERRVGKECRSR